MITATNYSAQQRVQRVMVYIMQSKKWVACSGVCMVGKTEIVSDESKWPSPMKTAYTDGYNVFLWKGFVESIPESELRFVILHENLGHKMHRHLVTWRHLFNKNPMLANIACDMYVNAMILEHNDPGVVMPKEAVFDAKYADLQKWDVGSIYKDLEKNGLPQGMGGCSGNCKASSSADGTPSGQCSCPVGFDEHDWQASEGMSAEEQKQAREAIDSAIRQGAILAGKMAGDTPRDLGDLMKVNVDYKHVLREFLTNYTRGGDESSWSRPNRRWIGNDIYMPTSLSQSMGKVVLALDTSGSIDGKQLTYFLSNVVQILQTVKPDSIELLYWDSAVAGHESYTPDQFDSLPSSTKPKGGGGTSPSCVSAYLAEKGIKPECVVMLSDGWIGSDYGGQWSCPVVWCIKGMDGFTAPTGHVVVQLPDDLA